MELTKQNHFQVEGDRGSETVENDDVFSPPKSRGGPDLFNCSIDAIPKGEGDENPRKTSDMSHRSRPTSPLEGNGESPMFPGLDQNRFL